MDAADRHVLKTVLIAGLGKFSFGFLETKIDQTKQDKITKLSSLICIVELIMFVSFHLYVYWK